MTTNISFTYLYCTFLLVTPWNICNKLILADNESSNVNIIWDVSYYEKSVFDRMHYSQKP